MNNIMWKYFTANNTQKYIDVLPSMVEKYNNTYHRSIKLTPSDAHNPANYQHEHNALYAKVNARKATSPKFHVGDKVRITRKKGTFEKGFTPNWTEELFTIRSVEATKPATNTIKDTLGEPDQGTFYEQELQLSAQECFRIERVLKKKKNQVFVKWKGYSDAWVPLTDLEAWISISNMLSGQLKTVVKTILSFLGNYEDWLLEKVNASPLKNLAVYVMGKYGLTLR